MRGSPRSENFSFGTWTKSVNADPPSVWQSVQWHTPTLSGSISASKRSLPQWQAPSIFIRAPSAVEARVADRREDEDEDQRDAPFGRKQEKQEQRQKEHHGRQHPRYRRNGPHVHAQM